MQQRMTVVQRQQRYIAAIEPQHVENVIDSPFPTPGNFAIEDDFSHRQLQKRLRNRRAILRETIARQEAYLVPLTEGQKPDPMKLAFEDPLRPSKPFLGEGRRHRLDPRGEIHKRIMPDSTNRQWCRSMGDAVTASANWAARSEPVGDARLPTRATAGRASGATCRVHAKRPLREHTMLDFLRVARHSTGTDGEDRGPDVRVCHASDGPRVH